MRLIDAEKAAKIASKYSTDYTPSQSEYEEGVADTWENAANFIHEFESVNAEPVVQARWELEKEPDGTPYCFHCSNCDPEWNRIDVKSKYEYCPHCGSKMDLEENE